MQSIEQAPFFIVIAGPTAVGKTDFALDLAEQLGGEIINADVGQFYTPLTIGTAKPDWATMSVPHHLFDSVSEPKNYNIVRFRADVALLMRQIWLRGKLPVIVGGSSFYLKSLYFPLQEQETKTITDPQIPATWENLYAIDPERALAIGKNDCYRIERALSIWLSSGIKPSLMQDQFSPLGNSLFIRLQRPRAELYDRINQRTGIMLQEGWLEEVESLLGTEWIPFLEQKKIIGYPEIIAYLRGTISYTMLVEMIKQKTRNYAKRQCTFLNMLERKLQAHGGVIITRN